MQQINETTCEIKPIDNTHKQDKFQKTIDELKIDDKVNFIVSQGFKHLGRVIKFLKLNDLDQQKALASLQEIRTQNQANKENRAKSESKKDKEKNATNFMDSEQWKQIVEKKKEMYKKFFPEDTEFDWEKFKTFKKDNKDKLKEEKKAKCEEKKAAPKSEKIQALYKTLFPEDTEFDCKKFQTWKKDNKEKFQKLKQQEKHKNFNEKKQKMKEELYKKTFPQDTEFDWEKFKTYKKEAKLTAEFEKSITPKTEFGKLKQEKKQALYKEFFPNDTEFDWVKFKAHKKSLKNEKNNSEEAQLQRAKLEEARKELYKKAFPDDTDFDWVKFKQHKKQLKQKDRKALSDFNVDKLMKKQNLYKIAFPEDTDFDWEKFGKFKKEAKEAKREKSKSKEKEAKEIKREKSKSKSKEKKIKEKKEKPEKLVKDWNKEFKHVFLDGNNLLFCHDRIQKIKLVDSNKAEKILALLAGQFGLLGGAESMCLAYDNTNNVFSKQVEGLELNVCSARPDSKSSIEVLMDWMDRKGTSSLVVTSDECIEAKLRERGMNNIMNSKRWMNITKEIIGKENFQGIMKKNTC